MLPWDPKGKNKKGCCVLRTEPWFSPRVGYIGVWLGMRAGRNRALEVIVHCLDSAFQVSLLEVLGDGDDLTLSSDGHMI